jgi:hypothetical protein
MPATFPVTKAETWAANRPVPVVPAKAGIHLLWPDVDPRSGVVSKSREKRLCRLMCGKPLAFRRRQPLFFPSARLAG